MTANPRRRTSITTLVLAAAVTALAGSTAAAEQTGGIDAFSPSAWRLSVDGVGPLRLGMSARDARKIAGPRARIVDATRRPSARAGVTDDRLELRLVRGHVVRIEVRRADVATLSGIRVGDTTADLRRAYGARLLSRPAVSDAHVGGFAYAHRDREIVFTTTADGVITRMSLGRAAAPASPTGGFAA